VSRPAAGAPGAQAPVLVCPDKFRGSLTAAQAANSLATGLQAGGVSPARILPVADGGEGTVDCCLAAGCTELRCHVTGADGRTVLARIAAREKLAIIESAQACGLLEGTGNPHGALAATSFGVGQLIGAALDRGYRKLIVGVGGTASTDGGAGLLQALGAQLRDGSRAAVAPGGGGLAALKEADLTTLDQRLAECELLVATDVDNPLLGPHGAAAEFGSQKGADAQAGGRLEHGLTRLAELIDRRPGPRWSRLPGAGAGGGIGYALIAVGARRVSGAETILDLLGFDSLARGARLVVTGEGSLDASSLRGKAPVTLARRAHRLGKPVMAVVGRSTLTPEQQREAGIDQVCQLIDLAGSSEHSMRQAPLLLQRAGQQIAKRFAAGTGSTAAPDGPTRD
jgi:glycerate 2-kinase